MEIEKRLKIFQLLDAEEREITTPQEQHLTFKDDVVRHRITGALPSGVDYSLVNFVGSTLHDIVATGIDFSECDFKDSVVRDAIFTECQFDNGAFATSFFLGCVFSRCTFYNLAAHSTEFMETEFVGCDLTNILIKSSKFSDCAFRRCKTSNRIAEMSVLSNVVFEHTDIQVDTITGNFGLTHEQVRESGVRSDRARTAHELLSREALGLLLEQSSPLTDLEKLRLEFYLQGTLISGSSHLDAALDLGRWTRMYSNPGSFCELIESFCEFIVDAYKQGALLAHPVLMFHYVTSVLTSKISSDEHFTRVARSIAGVHLILSRLVEDYLEILSILTPSDRGELRFLADGPVDRGFFERELSSWLGEEVRVKGVKVRNSPVELLLSSVSISALLPILAAFLAGRTKLEILRIKERYRTKSDSGPQDRVVPTARIEKGEESLFLFSAGTESVASPRHELQIRSLLPGSLVFELQLSFSTKVFGKLRRLLVDVLKPEEETAARRSEGASPH